MTGGGAEPFWEREYRDPDARAFGPPSTEILELIPRLPRRASVLDIGCGDGRNALPLVRAGLDVTAIDRSRSGVSRLAATAAAEGLEVRAVVTDLASFEPRLRYDLVLAHGVLHLLPPDVCERTIAAMQRATNPGGWNVVAVFTDRLPSPPDLEPFVVNLFARGALEAAYARWVIELSTSYILEDEHSGGIRHRHPVDKIVARRPAHPGDEPEARRP